MFTIIHISPIYLASQTYYHNQHNNIPHYSVPRSTYHHIPYSPYSYNIYMTLFQTMDKMDITPAHPVRTILDYDTNHHDTIYISYPMFSPINHIHPNSLICELTILSINSRYTNKSIIGALSINFLNCFTFFLSMLYHL